MKPGDVYLVLLDWLYAGYWLIRSVFSRQSAAMYSNKGAHNTAVVFVPGVYESWRFIKPLVDMVHAHGYRVHVVDGLGFNTSSVEDAAALLDTYIRDNKLTSVVLVAHSKGGLIGKYFMGSHNQVNVVRHMVTVNTPFSGSVYAVLAPVRNLRMFAPGNKTTKQLQANIAINNHITSVYSRYDQLITSGSLLEGAENIEIDTAGHFRIMGHPAAQKAILDTLQQNTFRLS